ncbi:MAG: HEPN domain-containing protein [Cytophagaceae bacterium]|nr:MAG: HEPN domain-containing protein [Cytophagaceae bacterium]
MSARLSTAIRIGDAARAILRKTKTFPDTGLGDGTDANDYEHIGVEPMLLALAIELALKAWLILDSDNPDVPKIHDLAALFSELKSESQEKLDAEFKRSVVSLHPNWLFADYSIRNILYQHRNAFIDWRYLHEPKNISFEKSAFEATLVMVLAEFRKRYRIEPAYPVRSL